MRMSTKSKLVIFYIWIYIVRLNNYNFNIHLIEKNEMKCFFFPILCISPLIVTPMCYYFTLRWWRIIAQISWLMRYHHSLICSSYHCVGLNLFLPSFLSVREQLHQYSRMYKSEDVISYFNVCDFSFSSLA